MRVERRERLVEEEDGGVARQRAGERDTLPLAPREIARPRTGEVRDPEAFEQLVDALPPAEGDVAADIEVRKERVLLEDEPDRTALRRQIDTRGGVEPGVRAERDSATVRPEQPGDRVQHARLPGSRRSDERERLPPELEV